MCGSVAVLISGRGAGIRAVLESVPRTEATFSLRLPLRPVDDAIEAG